MTDPTLEELLRAYGHGYEPAGPQGNPNSTVSELYGHGYEHAGPQGNPNSLGWAMQGPTPSYSTADYTRIMGDQQRAKEQAPYHSISNILTTLATLGTGIGASAGRVNANPRANVAGRALVEQSGKPTAGTTPLSPRAAAVEQGHAGMYELQGSPFEKTDVISPRSLEHAQQTMNHVRSLQEGVAAGGEFGELAALQLKRMQRYGDIDAARRVIDEHHAGPRAQNYWRGLDQFDKAEVPVRALSQDENGRFYDKNRLNAAAAAPSAGAPLQEQDDLLAWLAQHYPQP